MNKRGKRTAMESGIAERGPMQQILKEYRGIFRKIFTEYQGMLLALALVCLLGFGFTITHHSIGVDNNAHDLYYLQGGAISQGRLTAWVLDRLFGIYSYPPFWANFMGALVLYTSSLVWCALFIRIGQAKIGPAACLIFASVLISYPVINEHFIFTPLDLPLGYGLTAVALALCYEADIQKQTASASWAIIVIVFIISLNESFAAVFLCGMLCLFMLENLFAEQIQEKPRLIERILLFLSVLAAGIAVEWIVAALVRVLSPSAVMVPAGNMYILWLHQPVVKVIQNLTLGLIGKYMAAARTYFPIAVSLGAGVTFVILAIYLTAKKKKPILLLLAVGIILSVVSISIVKGTAMPYRTDSALGLFVAFSAMLAWLALQKRWQRVIWAIAMVLLVINQTRVLNNWFVNDYERYQHDREIVENVSYDLERNCDITKPVLMIGSVDDSAAIQNIEGEYNGVQFFNEYLNGREKPDAYPFLLIDFFRIHGHAFTDASEAYYDEGSVIAEDMPSYPKPGYIREEENYIIVNFN